MSCLVIFDLWTLTLLFSEVALVLLLVVGQEVFLEAALVEVGLLAAIEEKARVSGLIIIFLATIFAAYYRLKIDS